MASRFFAAASQSESEEDQDQRSEPSDKGEEVQKPKFYYESSSDEDQRRVVRSAKDKRFEALTTVIDRIKDKMRIEDFVAMADEFDELNKQFDKSKKVIEKEGVPLFYIRICYVLENFLTNLPADKKSALKPANKKAYNTLKHKVKKNNKLYEDKLKAFAEKPTYSDEEDEDDDEDVKKATKKGKAQGDDSDDEEWKSKASESDDEDEDEDEEDDVRKYLESSDPMVRRNYWLKRETADVKKKRERKIRAPTQNTKFEEDEEEVVAKPKRPAYTLDELDKKIVEIVERRAGRKAFKEKKVSVEDDLEALQEFFDKVKGDDIKRVELLLILMPTRLDYSRQFSQYCMSRALWFENFENLQEFLKIIKNKKASLNQVRTFQKDGDLFYKENAVVESFSTHFDGLDNELYKAFKTIEPSTFEYAERLRDYASMIRLSDEAVNHFKTANDDFHSTKFAQKKLEYTYYMPDKLFEKLRVSAADRAINTKNEFYQETASEKVVHELATKVYTSNDNKLIIKTLLYHIYNHAINGRYHVAKEYFLMSHIPEIASGLDAATQIIYNRTLVQLGISAFSLGLIQESVNALADIMNTGKIRELLGQGISKYPVNEKEERRRLLPYHMHINIELVETVYLIAAMLNEIPNIMIDPVEASKKQASKAFRRQYELYKNFYGPPETSRDRIMIAGKDLQHGDWRKCYDNLTSTNLWGKITQDAQKTKENLLNKVKEQAFKCYVFSLQNCYDSISIESIATRFDLDKDAVHAIISKLVFNREIKAYLDIDSNCLIFEKGDTNKLESKALILADRVSTLLVNNEKIMDSKYGNYGITDKDIAEGLAKNRRPQNKKKLNTILNKDKRKPRPRKG
jgi:translation initiation factor 3 subunit C